MEEKLWVQIPYEKSVAESLHRSLDVGFPLCVILAQRGIESREQAEKFLWPKLSHLDDPFKIKNIDKAVDILRRVVENNLHVAMVGDYDVDGITSITLLTNVLRAFNVSSDFFVPKRAYEGYGLSSEIIERVLSESKYDVVVVLDCGTNSVQEVEFLQKNGVEVLIIDHHQTRKLPVAKCCIVNPHVNDHGGNDKHKILCTVGLVFKLCCALLKVLRRRNDKRAMNYSVKRDLDLVTLGTIADMAHLINENRIMCRFGLKILSGRCRRPGIEALCKSADIPIGADIQQSDVSFKLCPRLNACGRLADAVLPVNMMLSDNFDEAMTYAYELDETNRGRQLIEREITVQAEQLVRSRYMGDNGLVLYDKNWHAGVVGIISGKFAKDYSRPCVVLGDEREMARGSGRSANGANLIDILGDCSEYLEAWGGHPYAVGVSILPKKIDEFRKKFNEAIARHRGYSEKRDVVEYCMEVQLEEVDNWFVEELDLLKPFGQKNQEPVFLLRDIRINALPEAFGAQKAHVKFWLVDRHSKKVLVIGWNAAQNIPPTRTQLDLIVTISRETWNRVHSIRLNMIDWRLAAND